MSVIRHSEDLLTRIKDLERQVRELRRGTLYNAAITEGGLEVRTPDGDTILRAGELEVGGQAAFGMEVYRRDGSRQARFFDTAGGGGYFAFYDEQQNVIFSNDTVSGQGLATPYVPGHWMPYTEVLTPPVAVTSAGYTITHRLHLPKQHPRVRVLLLCDSDADTTGQVILAQAGVQLGPAVDVELGANTYAWLDAEVPGAHMQMLYLDLQVRRVAGTGNVRVAPAWVGGVQS